MVSLASTPRVMVLPVLVSDKSIRQVDEDLYAMARDSEGMEDQVKERLLLNVVVGKGAPVLQLLAKKHEALTVRKDALELVLDLGLDHGDGVAGLDLENDGPVDLYKNLHFESESKSVSEAAIQK